MSSSNAQGSSISSTLSRPTAGIILIGNELLSGQTADKNLHYIANQLFNHGVDLLETTVIPDIENTIIRVVRDYSARFTYVFTTGGIGPTHDDITSETIAKAFNRAYVKNEEAYALLRAKYGDKDFTDSRGRMTMMPEGARLIYNQATVAPGFNVENVYVMAGIPAIMQTMMDHVLTMIPKGQRRQKSIIACKVYESILAPGMQAVQDAYPHIEIGSYPHKIDDHTWEVRIAISGDDQEAFAKVQGQLLDLCRAHDPNAVLTSI